MNMKAIAIQSALTLGTVAGVAFLSRHSSMVRNLTKSESGGGFFSWLSNLFGG